ncbi:NTP transferase domain-containing protein [Geoalkalibacter halelectricus]|uniref:NTP transferase domain-containing protein n=1 Tax=Geoalkalibacter halelectricus TaxID=2847045 RepID=UPI003D1F7988
MQISHNETDQTSYVTAVILAGGCGRRMGHDKATFMVDGQTLFACIQEMLRGIFAQVLNSR